MHVGQKTGGTLLNSLTFTVARVTSSELEIRVRSCNPTYYNCQ